MTKEKEQKESENEAEDILKGGKAFLKDKIYGIKKTTNAEIYGESAINPENEIFAIETEGGAMLTTSTGGLDLNDGKFIVVDKVKLLRARENSSFGLRRFAEKYTVLPSIGMEVETEVSRNGFLKIVV